TESRGVGGHEAWTRSPCQSDPFFVDPPCLVPRRAHPASQECHPMAKTTTYKTKKRTPKTDDSAAAEAQTNETDTASESEELDLSAAAPPQAAAAAPAPAPVPVAEKPAPVQPPQQQANRPQNPQQRSNTSSDEALDAETQERYEQAKRQDISIRDLQKMTV